MVNSHYGLIRRHGACGRADCVFNQMLPAAEQTRAKRRGGKRRNKAKQAEQAVTIAFLSEDKSEIVVYCFCRNESMREWILNGVVFQCYYCVTAEINNLVGQKPCYKQKENFIRLMSLLFKCFQTSQAKLNVCICTLKRGKVLVLRCILDQQHHIDHFNSTLFFASFCPIGPVVCIYIRDAYNVIQSSPM